MPRKDLGKDLLMVKLVTGVFFVLVSTLAAGYDFEFVKEENGISIYKAFVEEVGVYRMRVTTTTKESIDSLLKINTDPPVWKTWMPKVTNAKFVEPGEQEYIVHMQYASPWPVKDRESVTKAKITKNPETGTVKLAFITVDADVPKSDDHYRIPLIEGFWTFTPRDEFVDVVYEATVDPGGSIPKWLVNMESVDIPFQTIVKMLENIDQYRDVRIDWLHQ